MKTKEEAKANLAASVTYIGERYKAGIARADWATRASSNEAEQNFADAMTKAISAKKRQAAVKLVSNAEWQSRAIEKGGAVIAERVRLAIDKQAQNWGIMYDAVVSEIQRLPARTVNFEQNITARLIPTVRAWKKAAGKL